jgi:hypothetical protein
MGDGSANASRLIGSCTGNALIGLVRDATETDVLAGDLRAIGNGCAREAGIDGRAAGGQVASRCCCCLAVGVREACNAGLDSCIALGLRSIFAVRTSEASNARIGLCVANRPPRILAVGARDALNAGLGICLTRRTTGGIRAISRSEALDTGVVRGTDGFQWRAMVVAHALDAHV